MVREVLLQKAVKRELYLWAESIRDRLKDGQITTLNACVALRHFLSDVEQMCDDVNLEKKGIARATGNDKSSFCVLHRIAREIGSKA